MSILYQSDPDEDGDYIMLERWEDDGGPPRIVLSAAGISKHDEGEYEHWHGAVVSHDKREELIDELIRLVDQP